MSDNPQIGNLGEVKLIKIIEQLVKKKTRKPLIRDDAFFFDLLEIESHENLVLNSDMLVSSTDIPLQMNSYQIGKKSVIMNISDLLVKGVQPKGIILSLGLPKTLAKADFIDIITGIIDTSSKFNLKLIGGDINETKEIVIAPTVFGFKHPSEIILRKGIKAENILVINKRFGLTGVGFDILLNKNVAIDKIPNYTRSVKSVLEPEVSGIEALFFSERKLATSSIDSSDGLSKSLLDLMISNPNIGFEIDFNEYLIDQEAFKYSQEYNAPLEDLVFNGGEEYIHLFTMNPNDFSKAKKIIQSKGGDLFKVGKVISEESVYILKENERIELKSKGFEHFN
ncbi:MAG: thiamine-monophosphate kinase [Candidatus Hermodarchaeota archaeon]